MSTLTRRRSPVHPFQQCWLIYYGDIHAGTISERTGNPHDTEPWEWQCGFYPGSRPGECTSGRAETLDQARADFEAAWKVFLSKRTEAGLPSLARSRSLDSREVSPVRSRR